ncbi:MAG: aldo/keto reductase [Spirochaetes bacterium]|nr:aldo/keto reductase [Spirochaetota bacterium]
MFYYNIRDFEIPVSTLIFGCWQLSKKGWRSVQLHEARETLHLAVEKGVTVFDTAPIYGYGLSETILGEELSSIRSKINIFSKCGLFWKEGKVSHDNSPDSIERQINESLKRLKTDYIDGIVIHWPDNKVPVEITLKCLNKLRDQKIIRSIGLSNFSVEILKRVIQDFEIDIVQYKYNYLEREVEKEILQMVKDNNIRFWAYSPLAQGLLTDNIDENYNFQKSDIRKLNPLFEKENLIKAVEIRNSMGENPIKKSLGFLVKNEKVDSIIIGMSKKTHLTENLDYFKLV